MKFQQSTRLAALMNNNRLQDAQNANILMSSRTARRALAKLDKRKAKRTVQGGIDDN
jgi:hypothetical protein